MRYAKMFNCSAGIIACICFIACGRKTSRIDEQGVKINSIPCGYSGNKPAADSMLSYDGVKTDNKEQNDIKNKSNIK
jgi:hypothetical protein